MGVPDFEKANPHGALAALVGDILKIEIDPDELRFAINNNWRRIQTLAHLIHDEYVREAGRAEVREQFKSLMGEAKP